MTLTLETPVFTQGNGSANHEQIEPTDLPATVGLPAPASKVQHVEERDRWLRKQVVAAEMRQALEQLIPVVAHEVNNALTVLIGNVQLVEQTHVDEETAQLLSKVSEEAHRIMRATRNLLAFAQDSTDEAVYVDVNMLLTGILDLLDYHLRINNVEVETHLDRDLPPALGDVYQLRYLFFHLISAATEHLGGNQHRIILSVYTSSGGGMLNITIENGRAEAISAVKPGGGVMEDRWVDPRSDLFLCWYIVRQHGGRLRVSNSPDGEKVFHVELPIAHWPDSPSIETGVTNAEPWVGCRILVADDEQDITALVSRVLTADGCEVDTAHDGKAALAKLQAQDYDLVLLNLRMPEADGKQVYEYLLGIAPDRARRVIFITGDTCQRETLAFLRSTGNPYITKPFDLDLLKALIWRTLAENAET